MAVIVIALVILAVVMTMGRPGVGSVRVIDFHGLIGNLVAALESSDTLVSPQHAQSARYVIARKIDGAHMKIGALAQAAQTQAETIRFYEREGLLPEAARTQTNYRVYEARHIQRLAFIRSEERRVGKECA